jgi:lipopolysaccharide export system protein LptC
MAPSLRETILGLALAVLGLLAWWYGASREPAPAPGGPTERRPDYVVEDVTGVTMDADGRPARRLVSPQLRHYPDDGSTELDRPLVTVFDDAAPPWRVQAERGWIDATGDELLLEGAVQATRAATPELEPVKLTTSELLVLVDTDYAETDRFAELERGADWVTANDGMRVWFSEPMRVRTFGRTRSRVGVRSSTEGDD